MFEEVIKIFDELINSLHMGYFFMDGSKGLEALNSGINLLVLDEVDSFSDLHLGLYVLQLLFFLCTVIHFGLFVLVIVDNELN